MTVSTSKFIAALKLMPEPSVGQRAFLRAHFDAPGRAMTVTKLAKAAKYKNWRGINLQYGKLAAHIGQKLGIPKPDLELLTNCIHPKKLTNAHWILIMHSTFASALEKAGWI